MKTLTLALSPFFAAVIVAAAGIFLLNSVGYFDNISRVNAALTGMCLAHGGLVGGIVGGFLLIRKIS